MAPSQRTKKTTASKGRWQKQRGEELEMPSGHTALVRRPGPAALLANGVLPDAMTSMVSDMINTGRGMSKAQQAELGKNPEMLAGMVTAMDKVLCSVVLEPHVWYQRGIRRRDGEVPANTDPAPGWRLAGPKEQDEEIPVEERDEDRMYADEVDFDDKSFVFNFAVGGTRDIARFRSESNLPLGTVSDDESGAPGTE